MRRVVTWLTRDIGIRQYLDIGTGLPSAEGEALRLAREEPDVPETVDEVVRRQETALDDGVQERGARQSQSRTGSHGGPRAT